MSDYCILFSGGVSPRIEYTDSIPPHTHLSPITVERTRVSGLGKHSCLGVSVVERLCLGASVPRKYKHKYMSPCHHVLSPGARASWYRTTKCI